MLPLRWRITDPPLSRLQIANTSRRSYQQPVSLATLLQGRHDVQPRRTRGIHEIQHTRLKARLTGRFGDGHQHGHGYATHRDFERTSILNGPDIFGHFVFDFRQLNLQGNHSKKALQATVCRNNAIYLDICLAFKPKARCVGSWVPPTQPEPTSTGNTVKLPQPADFLCATSEAPPPLAPAW